MGVAEGRWLGVAEGRGLGVVGRWVGPTNGLAACAVPVDVVGLGRLATPPTPGLDDSPTRPGGVGEGPEPLDTVTAITTRTEPTAPKTRANFHPETPRTPDHPVMIPVGARRGLGAQPRGAAAGTSARNRPSQPG
jgi:hypothetical protein